MSGFIRLHRSAFKHPLLKDAERFKAWLWMVSEACWKPQPFDIQGKTVTLQRGQFCAPVRTLADEWGWSKSAVDRFLSRLETETMIVREAGHGKLIITICNYDKYQYCDDDGRDSNGTAGGTAAGQKRDLKEEGNKGRIEEPEGSSPPTPRHTRKADWPEIPDWVPVEPWNAFVQMRKDKRAPLTARAVKLTLKDLEKWMTTGQDPGAILDKSTQHCWTGIFELKDDRNGRNRTGQSAVDTRDGFTRSLHDDLYAHHAQGISE